MTTKPYKQWLYILYLAPMVLISCGGSSSSTSSTPTTSSTGTSGVIVDPFISGSVLCEDKDISGTCDAGEQVSSVSDASGNFTFSNALTPGSQVIIQTQGKHEGVTYDLDIAGIVDSSGNIPIVSPLTTFEAKGVSSAQIAVILNTAAANKNIMLSDGITAWTIAENQVLGNPMANNIASIKVGALTESDLSTLQASLASYALLKIMKGSTQLSALTSTDLYTSATTGEVNRIAQEVLSTIASTLTKQTLTDIKTTIDAGRTALANGLAASPLYDATTGAAKAAASLPEPSVLLPIKVAVAVIDRLSTVGFDTCNATVGTDAQKVTAALTAVANASASITPQVTQLGSLLYGMNYQTALSQLEDVGFGTNVIPQLPADLQTGYNAKNNGSVTYRFNNLNVINAL